jgi:hypothetical protein
VLQFHLFMCQDVQHIPIVIPGSGPDGSLFLRTLNMLLCGCIFVGTAWWARRVTVSTQTTVTELVNLAMKGPAATLEVEEEGVALTKPGSVGQDSGKLGRSDASIERGRKTQEV